MRTRAQKPFYGWIIVCASAIQLAIGLGMFVSTNSVFVKPVCDSLGFLRGEFTLHRTVITLVGAALMPLYGKLIRRFGVRITLLVCGAMLGLVTFGYSFSTRLWHFYFLAAVNGVFLNGVGFMSIGILINDWFEGKKGLALGLSYAGSGLGGAIMVPVVSSIIERVGWQWAYRFMGVFGVTILLPVAFFLIKNRPADLGLSPLPLDRAARERREGESAGLVLREALRTGRFWMLLAAFVLINAFAAAANTHSAPYLSDLGYAPAVVSAVISLFMLCLTLGKIGLGLIYDHVGTLVGNIVISVLCLGFPVFALLAKISWMPWVYAVFVGLASCGVSVPVAVLLNRHFGSKDFPAIFSLCSMAGALASSASVPAMGMVYDATGSYRPAWYALILFSVCISVCLIGAESARGRAIRRK